jgi:hypothetical protein
MLILVIEGTPMIFGVLWHLVASPLCAQCSLSPLCVFTSVLLMTCGGKGTAVFLTGSMPPCGQ